MSVASFRLAELPGVRPLYADFLDNFPQVGGFYSHPPSLDAARTAATDVRLDPRHRRRLVAELSRQNKGGDIATLNNLDRLANSGTVVVATGQQVGLLGGPVFTLFKAMTAVRCAETLTRQGVPAVPVFWMATEDHDLAEVDHAWILSSSCEPHRIEAATRGLAGAAVGEIEIADARLDEFESLSEGLPYAAEAVALARAAYDASTGFGAGFRRLYRELLAGSGIVFLSPMRPGVRELAAPLMRCAIKRAPDLTDQLLRRGAGLRAAGYHQQVHFQASSSLVLLFENAARMALKRKNGSYWVESRAYSPEDLLLRLDRSPLDISPSALLRPVMQDFLLPTAALVVGPSEASYLAQSSVLYEDLLGRMPAVLPRASFTVLDRGCAKLLLKYGMSPGDCMVPRHELESSIASAVVPHSLREGLDSHGSSVHESLLSIESVLRAFDPTLEASFKVSRRKIEYQLAKIRSKVSREALRRADDAQRHAARLAGFLYPNGHLQERVYSVLSFVAKFGPSFVHHVGAATRPGANDHKVIEI